MLLQRFILLGTFAALAACTTDEVANSKSNDTDVPAEVDSIPTEEEALQAAQETITEENADEEFEALEAAIDAELSDG